MLTRRHIRIKVLQSLYAYYKSGDGDMEKLERTLIDHLEQIRDLYLLMIQLLVEVKEFANQYMIRSQKKFMPTEKEKNPSLHFINNRVIGYIASSPAFLRLVKNRKIKLWEQNEEYVGVVFNALKSKDWYFDYLAQTETDLETDRKFILRFFREIIAPNEKIYEFVEDSRLSWLDDFPLVNTIIVKVLMKLSDKNKDELLCPSVYKHNDDREFALKLLRQVILNETDLNEEIEGKTPNWDIERIADIDMIILKMGIAEFLYFPSIPVRASINEYLEIAKEYSTPKSSLFINGILDKIVKELKASKNLNKIGRGLK